MPKDLGPSADERAANDFSEEVLEEVPSKKIIPTNVQFWLLVVAMLCVFRGNPEQCLDIALQTSSLIVW